VPRAPGSARYDPNEFGPVRLEAEGMRVVLQVAAKAVVLDPVVVEAARRLEQTAYGGFHERKESGGLGRYFDREMLERTQPLHIADVLRRVPSLEVRGGTGPALEVRLRQPISFRSPCPPVYYLDGMQVDAAAIAAVDPRDLEGVEVHTHGVAPAELNRIGSACGVIAVWTRRSHPGSR
jgi:hypothetical protein